jgi:hypothetical protein
MSDAVSSGTLTPAPCQKLSIVGKVLRLVNFTKREIDWQVGTIRVRVVGPFVCHLMFAPDEWTGNS